MLRGVVDDDGGEGVGAVVVGDEQRAKRVVSNVVVVVRGDVDDIVRIAVLDSKSAPPRVPAPPAPVPLPTYPSIFSPSTPKSSHSPPSIFIPESVDLHTGIRRSSYRNPSIFIPESVELRLILGG